MRSSTSSAVDCPLASPARQTIFARALHRACLILGGVAQLATHLEVTELSLRGWLEAVEEPPEGIFISAVEILLLAVESAPQRAS
jgi:hypothetical protein